MFTGIIEETGHVQAWKRNNKGSSLVLKGDKVIENLGLGDSIAINGVCLTVTALNGAVFEADVMPETLRLTNLKDLSSGDVVNLERAMSSGGRFGGHFVSGHIDGTGVLVSTRSEANAVLMKFSAQENITRNIIKKGSVAIDGISLTVVDIEQDTFVVSLVPHTLSATNLGRIKTGGQVNLETDMLGKYVEKYLKNYLSGNPETTTEIGSVTASLLQEKGFI